MRELVDTHEARLPSPWSLASAPEDYVRSLLPEIATFRMRITRLEGKVKLSQNRSASDRAGVIAGLREHGGDDAVAIATAMAAHDYPSDQAQPLLSPPTRPRH